MATKFKFKDKIYCLMCLPKLVSWKDIKKVSGKEVCTCERTNSRDKSS